MHIKQKNVTRLNAALFSAIILAGAGGTVFAMQPGYGNADITTSQRNELHTLVRAGNFEEAEALREELGSPDHKPGMHGMHEHRGMHGNDAMREAVEAGDYDAWKKAMEEHAERMIDNINEDHFNTLVKIRDLREVGRDDEARDLMHDLRNKLYPEDSR